MDKFIRKFKLHKELTYLHAKKDAMDLSCVRFDNIVCLLSFSLIVILVVAIEIGIFKQNGMIFLVIAFISILVYTLCVTSLCCCQSTYKLAYLEASQEYEDTKKKLNDLNLILNTSTSWESERELTLTLNDIEFISKMIIEFNTLNKV